MKKLLLLIAIFSLSGCGTLQSIITKPEVTDRPKIFLPEPMPAQQLPIEWTIITKENFDAKVKEIEKNGGTVVLFAITPEGYQNLSLNVAELRRYIQQQDAIIVALKKYYERPVEPTNKEGDNKK